MTDFEGSWIRQNAYLRHWVSSRRRSAFKFDELGTNWPPIQVSFLDEGTQHAWSIASSEFAFRTSLSSVLQNACFGLLSMSAQVSIKIPLYGFWRQHLVFVVLESLPCFCCSFGASLFIDRIGAQNIGIWGSSCSTSDKWFDVAAKWTD